MTPELALAALDKLEQKRKENGFIRYWLPVTESQRAGASLITDAIKIAIITGGNRSGKTEVGAAITAAFFYGKKFFEGEPAWEWVQTLPIPERPRNIWIVGLDFPTLRDVLWREKLRLGKSHPPFIGPEGSYAVKKVNDSDYQIFGTDGSVITGKSADSGREKFQGASVDLVWIDEEPEEEIFDECYQRTVDCAGKILVTLTPLKDIASGVTKPWVHNLIRDMRAGQRDIATVAFSVLDNPFVPEIEKQKLLDKWAGHPEEGARLYGHFIQRSGLVYNLWDPSKHLIRPFFIPPSWRRIVSLDPANTGPSGCIWSAVSPSGDLYLYREYKEANLVISDHARNLIQLNQGEAVDMWLIDPKWGTQREGQQHKTGLQLYREATGFPFRLATVGEDYGLNSSREYVAATVGNTGAAKLYVFNDLKEFHDEISHYTWDFFQRGEMRGLSKEKPRKGNDDLLNAFQYITSMRPRGKFGVGPVISEEDQRKAAYQNSYTQ